MVHAVEYVERVGLIDRAAFALRNRVNAEGLTRTDAINRALQMYDLMMTEVEKGNKLVVFDPRTQRYEEIRPLPARDE